MHPAPSVIIFTTLSGAGFGLLFWLGFGLPGVTGCSAFAFFTIAYLLAVGGLIASTTHLGHPERALKAFSQWRTSWLSREGVAAVACLLVMALYGAGKVFVAASWQPVGWIGSVLALATVFTTSMIYTQMKTVPRWRHWTTPALFLAISLGGGALLAGQIRIALPLLIVAGALQVVAWRIGDRALAQSGTTLATGTGLGAMGSVRAFEPPHTGTNYLLREFCYVVGRRHSRKLRLVGGVLGFGVPVIALVAMMLVEGVHILAAIAVLSHIAGILALRWLFFAEAEHVVGLYYGKRAA